MIVIGYQGIGKSTLAKTDRKYLDLESSNFWVDGKRDENWYKVYCKQAINFSRQGYIVFTSSHQVARDYFKEIKDQEMIIVVCPSFKLKNKWIKKLKDRYKESHLDKDYKAWKNAEDRYEENVLELHNDNFFVITISDIKYNLEELLRYFVELDAKIKEGPISIPTVIREEDWEEMKNIESEVTYITDFEEDN